MSDIDRAIEGVEQLYRSLTGHPPGNGGGPYEVIPGDVDPARYVELQLERLTSVLGGTPAVEPWVPALAMWATHEAYFACLDVAGVAHEALSVGVTGQGILVEGTRTALKGMVPSGAQLIHREQGLGPCRRLVGFPADAVLAETEAKRIDGALLLRVPRIATRRDVSVQ